MTKKIIIEEKQFQKILERYYGKSLLTEMPYSPKDYSTDCAVHAIMVYIHLGKLFLFGDTTNNGEDWVKQILNHHLIPMVTASYTSSIRSKTKMFHNGFVVKYFGMDYTDFETTMANFCDSAIDEVKSRAKRLYNKEAIPLRSIEEAVTIGMDIVKGLMELSESLLSNLNANEVRGTLKPFLMKQLKDKFGIEFDVD